jgi:uncharacterized repeat protein (TIGR03803 family)
MVKQQIGASIFDFSLRAGKAALVALGIFVTILTVVSTAHAQTLSVLHTFNHVQPDAGVTLDAAGNLYGTTNYGSGAGVVYKLAHKGSGWVFSPLYSFRGHNDGAGPMGGVTLGRDGNLYGTTFGGGQFDAGTVYKLSPPPTFCRSVLCPWTETLLYQFTGGADGDEPVAGVTFDAAGNLYGTTEAGGTNNYGVVFKLTPSSSGWTESVLYRFAGSPDGQYPSSALIFDDNGNLYGTTFAGGERRAGTVYQLRPSGSGWTEQVIYGFQSSTDGEAPSGIVRDPEGNLYGTAPVGGPGNEGTIFELMPSDGNWTFSVLYSPMPGGSGSQPVGMLARSSSGTLYGTFFYGGIFESCGGEGCGSVFQLSPSAGGWVYTSLYEFTGGDDGGEPNGGLILDSAGNLYGTTSGEVLGYGSAFELAP